MAHLFRERVEATPEHEAYRYPVPSPDGGPDEWRSYTWAQAADRVYAVAAGLMALGLRTEERVAIASTTRVEWIVCDLGVLCAGGATTTVYPQTDAGEAAFILADSDSRVLIAEDAEQLAKVRARREELPGLAHVVVIESEDAAPADGDPPGWVVSLDDLLARGRSHLAAHPNSVLDSIGSLAADQLATLIYTSGTTGRPKGVRLRHDTWSYMGRAIGSIELLRADDLQYLWLPLAHVFGKVLLAAQLTVGHSAAVDGRVDRIVENLPVVRPTSMAAVPRIFEKVYNGAANRARDAGRIEHLVFRWAAEVAKEYGRVSQENLRRIGSARVPTVLRLRHAVADKLVLSKLRERFGGRLRGCLSGSAALSPEIGYFFAGAGIPVLEGYGLTESGAANFVNPLDAYRTGTVGKALPGLEVRIAEDGEILLRGPGVMEGYHHLPGRTAEALAEDGWLRTGDIGELSDDGYLRITDRKKDLIKTSGGKYIAPTAIEGRLKAVCPHVSHVLVIGAGRSFCSALIALDEPSVTAWAADNGMAGRSYREIVADPRTVAMVDGYVARLNAGLQRWQTIKQFRLLPRDLDVEHGELTAGLKLKRPVVEREYRDLIDRMYGGDRPA
ncbi:AMP-dependent synthetase/ligase [Streptomyces bohaiensis]